jgi:hypothetical protein
MKESGVDPETAARTLNLLAEGDRKPNETPEQAYVRVLKGERGRYLSEQMVAPKPAPAPTTRAISPVVMELFGRDMPPAGQKFAEAVAREHQANGMKRGESLQQTFSRMWRDPSYADLRNKAKAEYEAQYAW